ncbi:MAG: hypothetical protein JSS02_03525 [Planctomycetes bacterium]|nr:hypothetical protein [Planctomycetota bacterium]
MPRMTLDAILQRQRNRSRLGESLQRLQSNIDGVRLVQTSQDSRFEAWQVRWLDRCEQLRKRLEALDQQLAVLGPAASEKPQLSLLTAHHGDELNASEE